MQRSRVHGRPPSRRPSPVSIAMGLRNCFRYDPKSVHGRSTAARAIIESATISSVHVVVLQTENGPRLMIRHATVLKPDAWGALHNLAPPHR